MFLFAICGRPPCFDITDGCSYKDMPDTLIPEGSFHRIGRESGVMLDTLTSEGSFLTSATIDMSDTLAVASERKSNYIAEFHKSQTKNSILKQYIKVSTVAILDQFDSRSTTIGCVSSPRRLPLVIASGLHFARRFPGTAAAHEMALPYRQQVRIGKASSVTAKNAGTSSMADALPEANVAIRTGRRAKLMSLVCDVAWRSLGST